MELSNKTVFITGGAQGVGRAVAEAVLKKGSNICIADLNTDQGETTLKELKKLVGEEKVIYLKCDVSDTKSFENCFQRAVQVFGRVDVMINNAGIVQEKNWQKCIDVNFTGVVRGTMLALEHMRKDDGGQGGVIINTASTAGLGAGYWIPVYAGTKSAVVNFTASWAANPDMEKAGVRFAVVCPGGTSTAMVNNLHDDQLYHKEAFIKTMEDSGLCDMDDVTRAFTQAIEDGSSNGSIYLVTKKGGVKTVTRSIVPVEK